MPLVGLLVLVGLNFAFYVGLKIRKSWDRAATLYQIRTAYQEGRKKILGC